jgi:hypothetical protein
LIKPRAKAAKENLMNQNVLYPMDLVADLTGEYLVVSQKKPDDPETYWAISLESAESEISGLRESHARKVCSLTELPKAVQALLTWSNTFSPTGSAPIPAQVSATIQIIGELRAVFEGSLID